jgi:hypothetical protein
MRPARTFEIRESGLNEFLGADAVPEVELTFTHKYDEYTSDGYTEALSAEELVDLHRKITLFLASVAGNQFLSDADINYHVKISSALVSHPQHDACRRSR